MAFETTAISQMSVDMDVTVQDRQQRQFMLYVWTLANQFHTERTQPCFVFGPVRV
jgi:hypothetical protein